MNGDFSRDTSQAARRAHFTRVLLQQGRPLLDAEFNEQSAILLDLLRMLATDIAGRAWRPEAGEFAVAAPTNAVDVFTLSKGHFYVDGILCDNQTDCTFGTQPLAQQGAAPTTPYFACLECMERSVSAVQRPALREVALGDVETATRAQVVWRVTALDKAWTDAHAALLTVPFAARIAAADPAEATTLTKLQSDLPGLTTKFVAAMTVPPADIDATLRNWFDGIDALPPRLRARAQRHAADDEACAISPESRYRGPENQLYRVEIQRPAIGTDKPRFKWSRENASVSFRVRGAILAGSASASPTPTTMLTVPVESLGHDARTGVCVGDWIEPLDDASAFDDVGPALGQVMKIDRSRRTLSVETSDATGFLRATYLRRWDHAASHATGGAALVVEDAGASWIALEHGVAIQFQPGGVYRYGLYWLIPARVASGDVQWLQDAKGPVFAPPDGTDLHRAVIGIATKVGVGGNFVAAGRTLTV